MSNTVLNVFRSDSQRFSRVAIEMFKVGGDKCLKSLGNIFNGILIKDKLLEEWLLSSLVPIFKGKGDLLNPSSYSGIKLLEPAYKLSEKILNQHFCEVVGIYASERDC